MWLLVYIPAQIVSSVISSTILRPQFENGTEPEPLSDEDLAFCGANYCPNNNNTNINLEKTDATVVGLICLARIKLY